jgi:GTP-binding protein EngB required for normal cell division
MNAPTSSASLLEVLDEVLMLINETKEYHSSPDVKDVLQEAIRALVSVRRRQLASARKYVVGVVGLTNVGKSTLLNALLGDEIAPRRNGPCTSAPIEFVYGESIVVTVYHKRSLSRPSWKCNTPEDIHRHLKQMADDAEGVASRTISRLIVSLPHSLLANGLVISDTPGFGAAQAEGAEGSHEESLKEYLQRDVSQVFWVVLADQGIGSREKRFHDDFFSEVCDDVVVTGCDDWDKNDCARFRRRFADSCGNRRPAFHFVSGLQGLQAKKSQDQSALESAGITALESRIRELANPIGREAAARSQILQLTEDIAWWLNEFRDSKDRSLQEWWRPDSWLRFTSLRDSDPYILAVVSNLEQRK